MVMTALSCIVPCQMSLKHDILSLALFVIYQVLIPSNCSEVGPTLQSRRRGQGSLCPHMVNYSNAISVN
jgi:hypothetical protein